MSELRYQSGETSISPVEFNLFGLGLDKRLLTTLLVSGALAMVGFDLFGQTLSPLMKGLGTQFLGAKLAPVGLATQTVSKILAIPGKTLNAYGIGHGVHVLTGLLLYPLGFVILNKLVTNAGIYLPWWISGMIYGSALFVFALYIVAHLIAGNKPFLGWAGIAWVALWGHIIYGLILAAVVHYRDDRFRSSAL